PISSVTILFALLVLLLTGALAACGVDVNSVPTFTPDPALEATAGALFPTPVPSVGPTATPVAEADDAAAIVVLLRNMEIALQSNQDQLYLSYVDLSDPVFALEQTRWVEDWHSARVIVQRFELEVRNLVIDGDEATGDLNMQWTGLTSTQYSRGADFPVRFTRDEDGEWRYAGELWVTFETEHFVVRAAPGLEASAEAILPDLPDVYARVTAMLDYEPSAPLEIKLYDNPWALIATTRFSLVNTINGWNEPGEALKLNAEQGPPAIRTIAHEFTHYLTFDMAGVTRGNYPWWVAEGMSMYAASLFWTGSERNGYLNTVRGLQEEPGLVNWEDISDFERTPEDLWQFAYAQGYAFVRYVSETYGDDARNEWVRSMAGDQDVAAATEAAFGVTFEQASADFFDWLAAG
ncbi:MAG: hypothetical protein JW910_00950, partial [Anaerolineae bacterium]|nr:hypothetical protein [Anaerolineae bacterium]